MNKCCNTKPDVTRDIHDGEAKWIITCPVCGRIETAYTMYQPRCGLEERWNAHETLLQDT